MYGSYIVYIQCCVYWHAKIRHTPLTINIHYTGNLRQKNAETTQNNDYQYTQSHNQAKYLQIERSRMKAEAPHVMAEMAMRRQ